LSRIDQSQSIHTAPISGMNMIGNVKRKRIKKISPDLRLSSTEVVIFGEPTTGVFG